MAEDITSLYTKEDSHVSVHYYPEYPGWQEQDVRPLHIQMPTVESFYGKPWDEAIQDIDGYGLKPEDQHVENYRKLGFYQMPQRLLDIENTVRATFTKSEQSRNTRVFPEDIFDYIESRPVEYAAEIAWIKLQQKRVIQGYWMFIRGKPVYIDGWHYLYLMCVPVGNKRRKDRLPFYRDIDRKIFFFYRWAETTTTAFYRYVLNYRKHGDIKYRYGNNRSELQAWADENGFRAVSWIDELEGDECEIDTGRRTIYGVVFPKRRRVGGTTQAVTILSIRTFFTSLAGFAIQALTKETAKDDVYGKKFLPFWRAIWFFYKPSHHSAVETRLRLVPRDGVKLGNDVVPHGGWVAPRSSENKSFDGNEIHNYLRDEPGKVLNKDIGFEFADTIKSAMAYGDQIHGLSAYVSTLGDFEEGGGRAFFDLILNSLHHERGDHGQTLSGMATLFIPAFDGQDRHINIYGESVILDPPKPYINLEGDLKDEGALSFLTKKRNHYERTKKWSLLNTELRNDPFTLREASMPVARDTAWDTTIVREVMADIRFSPRQTRFFKLYWSDLKHVWQRPIVNNINAVMEECGDEPGAWEVSVEPMLELRNIKTYDHATQTWRPGNTVRNSYVLGTDAFSTPKSLTTSSYLSKGAGHMFWKRDINIDTDEIPPDLWQSHTTVATYLHRPDDPLEYAEQMLLAAVLWGSMVNQERNHPIVGEKFIEWGFKGYLIYPIDKKTGKFTNAPGTFASPETHQRMFDLYMDYIKHHIRREKHYRFLEQILHVTCSDDITKNDLFAAGGMSFIGADNPYTDIVMGNTPQFKLRDIVEIY